MPTGKAVANIIYLDTNIILDYTDRRDNASIHLLETLRNKKRWKCSSSVFTMMELCDVKKDHLFFQNTYVKNKWTIDKFLRERYNRNLVKSDFDDITGYVRNVKETLKFIDFLYLTEDGWKIALQLSTTTNLRTADCIQLATAITLQCNSLVTKDKFFQDVVKELNDKSENEIIKIKSPQVLTEEIEK
ncbi:MAG: PIN domain-containing protein [Bacteroidota bacterium]